MPRPSVRRQEISEAIKRRGGLMRVLRAAGYSLATILGTKLLDELTSGWVSRSLLWLGRQFWLLGTRPAGVVLLLFISVFALALSFVFIMAWWETRPKKAEPAPEAEKPPARPSLSPEERNSIEAARVIWRKVGNEVTAHPAIILEQIYQTLPATTWLALLLEQPLWQLRKSRENLDAALHDHSQVSHDEVIGRLQALFGYYMTAVRYMHACEVDHGVRLVELPYAPRYKRWGILHSTFVEELTDLALRSDYSALRHTLFDDNTRTRFVREAAEGL